MAERRYLARRRTAESRRFDRALTENRQRARAAVVASRTTLTESSGRLSAKILGQARASSRFATSDAAVSQPPRSRTSGAATKPALGTRSGRVLRCKLAT
jgi:hypothetical protein